MPRGSIWATEDEVAAFSLERLNEEIEHLKWRLGQAKRSDHRKSYFRRLARLESIREERFGITSPRRTLRARQD